MEVRLDLMLEFDDGISRKELLESMGEIYQAIGNNVIDYDVLKEEEV